MPDRYDNSNTIDKAFDVISKMRKQVGQPPPDEVSFVEGFVSCFGILTGRVDIGLDEEEPLDRAFDIIHRDIVDFGRRVADNQAAQNRIRERMNGFDT